MRKIVILLFISIFLVSQVNAGNFNIRIESPQITSTYIDYDIKTLYCNFSSNATLILEVWGNINVHPAQGYIKEYDVNITDVYGDYVHIFLMSDNGSEPLSFVSISGKARLINYSLNNSLVEWRLPSSLFRNISGEPRISAYAGIVDISQNKFIFLDHVQYPIPREEENYPYWLYIPIVGSVVALLIYVYLRKKK